jgi:hypothetical protein
MQDCALMSLQPNLQPIAPRDTFTPAHARAALRWFDTMREPDEWGLTIEEQIELLGGVKRRTFQAWKSKALAGEEVELSRDLLERLSLLLGIYKGLKIIAPAGRPDVAKAWFSTANAGSPFYGRSPKAFLLEEGSMEALYAVRRYFDAARG